jgi:hypothetical protein
VPHRSPKGGTTANDEQASQESHQIRRKATPAISKKKLKSISRLEAERPPTSVGKFEKGYIEPTHPDTEIISGTDSADGNHNYGKESTITGQKLSTRPTTVSDKRSGKASAYIVAVQASRIIEEPEPSWDKEREQKVQAVWWHS